MNKIKHTVEDHFCTSLNHKEKVECGRQVKAMIYVLSCLVSRKSVLIIMKLVTFISDSILDHPIIAPCKEIHVIEIITVI